MALASLLELGRAAGRRRSQVAGQPRNGQSAALSAQGQAGDLALPVGRADAPGNLRPQAAIGQTPRPADARFVHQGPADRPASRGEAELLRAAVRLQAVRQVGAGDLRTVSPSRLDRRRDVHHPLDEDRGHQPRPGPHLHEHRLDDLRPAGGGLLDALRPGQREPGPARLRRADLDRPRRADAADLVADVAQRLPSQPLPGREVPVAGRRRLLPQQPAGRHAAAAARDDRHDRRHQPAAAGGGRRPGNRHADCPVRTGLPHADQRAGTDGPDDRAQARAGDVRHDGQRRLVRGELPSGPAAGRAGRAFHPGLPSRLGHARRPEARHADQRQGDRSGLGRA